ncbi:MAG: WecB/TagA/CpsF family glycosyltransferase [Cyanobacteria bacterium P01_E01_bin.34]
MVSVSPLVSQTVIGTRVDATSYEDACDRILNWARARISCYVIAANVHVLTTARWEAEYRDVLHNAKLVTPDGMPLVWALRLLGFPHQQRVYGPDLMLELCDRLSTASDLSVYLYGGTPATLQRLQSNLLQKYPDLAIAGSYSPPFRQLSPAEEQADIERIHQTGAQIVLVALGCPKQEYWMARQQGTLQAVAIGVGAAFAFHSGTVRQAPRWMMRWGLEWLFRLWVEPRRLWKRYAINNPAFVALFVWQYVRYRLNGHPRSQGNIGG